MRKLIKKSTLLKIFDKLCPPLEHFSKPVQHYVIDGGHLLHKVIWQKPATYGDILSQYYTYITYHYGHSVTVVFDGYQQLNAKTVEQNRRYMGRKTAPTVEIFNSL